MKVLMIGLGSIGQRHLRNLKALRGDSLEILAYRVRGLSRTFSDQLEIREGVDLESAYQIQTYTDLASALAQKPQLAIIANITRDHMQCALACARAGCDLFLEKPLADDLNDVPELLDLIKAKKLVAFVGFQNRYHPAILQLKQWLDGAMIGQILSVDVEMGERLTTLHRYEDYRTTYMARADMGGGVVNNQLIHELDIIGWLFGKGVSVYALGGQLSSLEIDVDDVASVLIRTEQNGQLIPIYAHADFFQYPPTRRLKVIGSRGRIEIDLIRARARCWVEDQEPVEVAFTDFKRNDLFLAELSDFLFAVEHRSPAAIPLQAGIDSLELSLAIRTSLASGQIQRL